MFQIDECVSVDFVACVCVARARLAMKQKPVSIHDLFDWNSHTLDFLFDFNDLSGTTNRNEELLQINK